MCTDCVWIVLVFLDASPLSCNFGNIAVVHLPYDTICESWYMVGLKKALYLQTGSWECEGNPEGEIRVGSDILFSVEG